QWQWNTLPDPTAPVTMVCCNHNAVPFGEVCAAPKPSCGAPRSAANDTCLSCMRAEAGKPINLSNGNTYLIETDVAVPGLGGGLSLSRTWNSLFPATQRTYPSMFGLNWRSTFEERLIFDSDDGYVKYLRSDGSVWSFGAFSLGNPDIYRVAAPATDTTTTITNGTPNWTLTSKNGEKRLFDSDRELLTAIIDHNGNTTQLSYDSSNRLTSVTDPATRHLTFSYVGTSTLATSVTSDVGIMLSYEYDAQGRLTRVTKPDGTTEAFEFDA